MNRYFFTLLSSRRIPKARHNQRGSLAVTAIIALTVLLIIVLGLSTLGLAVLQNGSRTARVLSLQNLSASGIQYGHWQYANNNVTIPYSNTRNFGTGKFSVAVKDNSANITNTIVITSTATLNNDSMTTQRVFKVATGYHIISMASVVNNRIQNTYGSYASGYPEGPQALGGVPFDLETAGGNNCWNADIGSGTQVINVSTNIPNPTEVDTLISTQWGQTNSSELQIEFFGTASAYYSVSMNSNSDIRDWFDSGYTNTINNTTTTNVFDNGSCRFDKQTITLPSAFIGKTLTSIRITDTGANGTQRILLSGITVKN